MRPEKKRSRLTQRATRGAEDTQFADKRAAVMLSAKACRSSSVTCSVCSHGALRTRVVLQPKALLKPLKIIKKHEVK